MKEHRLFHTLDRPKYMLYWPMSDCVGFLVCAFVGAFSDGFLVGIVIGVLFMMVMGKARRRLGGRALRHFFYFHLPHASRQLPHTPPSRVRVMGG